MPSSLYGRRQATSGADDLRAGGAAEDRRPRRSGSTVVAAVITNPLPPGSQRRFITPAGSVPTCSAREPSTAATCTCVEPLRAERKASRSPLGDQRGDESVPSLQASRAPAPS